MNVHPKPEDRLEKPPELVRYDVAQRMGLPYVAGGYMDQPWIWVLEHIVIENVRAVMKTAEAQTQQTQHIQPSIITTGPR